MVLVHAHELERDTDRLHHAIRACVQRGQRLRRLKWLIAAAAAAAAVGKEWRT